MTHWNVQKPIRLAAMAHFEVRNIREPIQFLLTASTVKRL